MDKLDLENKLLKFGKASFNSSALVGLNKVEFFKIYGSALRGQDVKEVWKQVSKYTKTKSTSKAKKED